MASPWWYGEDYQAKVRHMVSHYLQRLIQECYDKDYNGSVGHEVNL